MASCVSNNIATYYLGSLLDGNRLPIFSYLETDAAGYVVPGTSIAELLVENKPSTQISVMTLGQCLLGGSAIALISAWLSMKGGSLTICCGDSSYRFGTTLIEEPPDPRV